MSLMSPLVPEGFNDVFQELLVSEKVWLWDWNYLWEFITNPLVKPMPQPTGTVRFVDPYTGNMETRSLPQKKLYAIYKPHIINQVTTNVSEIRPLYELVPVTIASSSVVKKTHNISKSNIQYTIDLEYAFDDVYTHS